MVATAELITKNAEDNEYEVKIVGNKTYNDKSLSGNGISMNDLKGVDNLVVEGKGENILITAKKDYDLVLSKDEYDNVKINPVRN